MATYYMRCTDEDECTGCGACVDACPVNALSMEGDYPLVDEEWCIGCGVCVPPCPAGAAKVRLRTDKVPPRDFGEMCNRIMEEKGLK